MSATEARELREHADAIADSYDSGEAQEIQNQLYAMARALQSGCELWDLIARARPKTKTQQQTIQEMRAVQAATY